MYIRSGGCRSVSVRRGRCISQPPARGVPAGKVRKKSPPQKKRLRMSVTSDFADFGSQKEILPGFSRNLSDSPADSQEAVPGPSLPNEIPAVLSGYFLNGPLLTAFFTARRRFPPKTGKSGANRISSDNQLVTMAFVCIWLSRKYQYCAQKCQTTPISTPKTACRERRKNVACRSTQRAALVNTAWSVGNRLLLLGSAQPSNVKNGVRIFHHPCPVPEAWSRHRPGLMAIPHSVTVLSVNQFQSAGSPFASPSRHPT